MAGESSLSGKKINLGKKFSKFSEYWSPRVVAELNDYQFKLAKLKGDFTWHDHQHTDEAFVVIKGSMSIELRDRKIELSEGEMYVVPKGVEHRPCAQEECHVMLIEPRGVVNTGEAGGKLTAENDVWI
jgi:mannose-6-phosphate isomerase-like protein (cupin superfamily)